MKRKVTISIDDGLVQEVKRIARACHTTLAGLIRGASRNTCSRERRKATSTATFRVQFRALSVPSWKANLDKGRCSWEVVTCLRRDFLLGALSR